MAKLVRRLNGNFDAILSKIEDGILNGSVSATLEESENFRSGDSRCAIRVFERYSYFGGNRVSLSVTLYQEKETIYLCAVTSGGSQAMFFKINTVGEEAFLDKLAKILNDEVE